MSIPAGWSYMRQHTELWHVHRSWLLGSNVHQVKLSPNPRCWFALQVYVYNKPVDAHVWSGQTASVLIISYDMFSRLKTHAVDAMLRDTGNVPTEKVCLINTANELEQHSCIA